MKIIDADDFYFDFCSQTITDEDMRFCKKVKYALDKWKELTDQDLKNALFERRELSQLESRKR